MDNSIVFIGSAYPLDSDLLNKWGQVFFFCSMLSDIFVYLLLYAARTCFRTDDVRRWGIRAMWHAFVTLTKILSIYLTLLKRRVSLVPGVFSLRVLNPFRRLLSSFTYDKRWVERNSQSITALQSYISSIVDKFYGNSVPYINSVTQSLVDRFWVSSLNIVPVVLSFTNPWLNFKK